MRGLDCQSVILYKNKKHKLYNVTKMKSGIDRYMEKIYNSIIN